MPSFQFDAATHVAPPAPSRDPLPRGMYQVMVIGSDIKKTQAGTGHFIELTLQVVDGEYTGRRVWDRLNVSNPNKTAEEIAKRALQELCLAVNVTNLTDTEQLHDKPVLAEIDIDRKDPSRNRVMGYAGLSAAAAPSAPAARPAVAPSPSARPAGRPWEKK
jgi:hypothetical protein